MSAAQIDRIRPEFLHNKPHFTNLVASSGGKTIHLSGLVASTSDGELVGAGDLAAQMAYIRRWPISTIRSADLWNLLGRPLRTWCASGYSLWVWNWAIVRSS